MRRHGYAHIVPGYPAIRWGKSAGASAPPAPGNWEPDDLGSALRAWYEFDTLSGSNGDPQGSVTDASGNGFNLTQAGGNRPTLAAADLNGLNTLRFTGASSQRYPLDAAIFSGLTAGSAYFIYKLVSDGANDCIFKLGSSGNNSHWPFSDGNIYDDFGSTTRKTVGNPSVSLAAYRIISMYSAASDWALYIDGGAGGSSGGTSPFFSTATNTVGWGGAGLQIGCEPDFSVFLNGWIAEVFFTNAKQSTGDRQKAEGYLAHKWGLTGNLDSGHPYKSVAPTV